MVFNFGTLKIILLLVENHEVKQLEKCSEILDQAMLIGCVEALYSKSQVFRDSLMDIFDQMLGKCLNLI